MYKRQDGYAVYKIRETDLGGGTKLSAADGFLQFMIERLLASSAPEDGIEEEDADELGDDMRLTSLQSITDFMNCAGKTLPDNIQMCIRDRGITRLIAANGIFPTKLDTNSPSTTP